MSSIRRIKRTKPPRPRREKAPKRLLLRDVLLIGGLAVAAIGGIWGTMDYQVYLAGRPEQIRNTRLGTEYLPEVPPRDPGRQASAYAGFAAAGVGAAISAFALVVRVIDKRHAMRIEGEDR